MPDEATKKDEIVMIPLPEEFKGKVVENNGVQLPLVQHNFLKGKNPGHPYLGFKVTPENLIKEVIPFLGIVNAADEFDRLLKRAAQNAWKNNTNEQTGEFSLEAFLMDIRDPSSTAMTIKQLDNKIEELTAFFMKEATNPENFKEDKKEAFRLKMLEVQDQMNAYKAKKEKRSNRGRAEEPEEAATVS